MRDNTQADHIVDVHDMVVENSQELDEILEDFYDGDIRQSDMGKAKQAILAWHNKQILESLDRLLVEVKRAYDKEGDFLEMAVDTIEAERNKLKDRDEE